MSDLPLSDCQHHEAAQGQHFFAPGVQVVLILFRPWYRITMQQSSRRLELALHRRPFGYYPYLADIRIAPKSPKTRLWREELEVRRFSSPILSLARCTSHVFLGCDHVPNRTTRQYW
ncbi:hypothetical protein K458DRAFT_56393 [Lentithecium fluviatile CBS 122367]|uniref:Uncharacterized protein n=1 Tax=Lentithecium fluviatile CBS 122367 TaxID=1168545 RepID=A0A6G1IY12_9PLEO|nr:hypothetical protein K458DRAFT_56393 [Lentithecium fluviatile CBS 122367]